MSFVYVYPTSGIEKVILQDGRICKDFHSIKQATIDESEFDRFIKMWRKRVNTESRVSLEFSFPGLTLVGLMPGSSVATQIEVTHPRQKEPTFLSSFQPQDDMTEPRKRGREPRIECEPAASVKKPRKGSMKDRVLQKALADEGTNIQEVTEMYEEELKGKSAKTPARIRAFEIFKLLHAQNGYGFEVEEGQIYAIT